MAVTLNANSSTGFIATSDTSSILQLQTGGTTALTVSAAQVVTLANPLPVASGGSGGTTSTGTGANVLGTTPSFTSTIGVGGATASASGAGITFPATQSASTDANTLDDYEEGTWTPSTVSSSNITSVTYSNAYYTKIGRQMTITSILSGTITSANTLTYVVISLPIVSSFNIDPNAGIATNSNGVCPPGMMIDPSSGGSSTVAMYLPDASVPASGSQEYRFTFTYFTS
jgi:hypothetical protein